MSSLVVCDLKVVFWKHDEHCRVRESVLVCGTRVTRTQQPPHPHMFSWLAAIFSPTLYLHSRLSKAAQAYSKPSWTAALQETLWLYVATLLGRMHSHSS